MPITYLQIFSMTDHNQAFDRYQGPYVGLNATLQTSEAREGKLWISAKTETPRGVIDRQAVENSKIVLGYRHTDTGELRGTSEMIIPIEKTPWTDMPGIEVPAGGSNQVTVKLFGQNITLQTGKLVRVHFMKTIVYLKFYGEATSFEWTEQELSEGPGHLHALPVDDDLTIAPPASGSALQVKMGQETVQ
jgi:hypothetical protein